MANIYTKEWEISDIKTILVDKDGTFLDSDYYWGKLAELRVLKLIEYFGLTKNLYELLCFAIGYNPTTVKLTPNSAIGLYSRDEVISLMVDELRKYEVITTFEKISELFFDVHNKFYADLQKYTKAIRGAQDFFERAKKNNINLTVVTSDTHSHAVKTIEYLGFSKYFDLIIGKDDCTQPKKTGEPALIALNKLNEIAENTISLGDAPMDAQMANNAELKGSILVSTGQMQIEDLKKYSNYTVENLDKIMFKI